MTAITGERLTSGRPRRTAANLNVTAVNGWVHVKLGLLTIRIERPRFDRFLAEALPPDRPGAAAGDGQPVPGPVPCELCEGETYRLVIDGRTLGAECTSCRTWLPLLTATPGGP